jgi:hypothetical protein
VSQIPGTGRIQEDKEDKEDTEERRGYAKTRHDAGSGP